MENSDRVKDGVMQAMTHRQWLRWITNIILLKGSSTMLQYRKALPLIQWKEYPVSFHESEVLLKLVIISLKDLEIHTVM
jgi:hypothetical protein